MRQGSSTTSKPQSYTLETPGISRFQPLGGQTLGLDHVNVIFEKILCFVIIYLLLFELFKMHIFKLCSLTAKGMSFCLTWASHKALGSKTYKTSANSLKLMIRQWELATGENLCKEGQVCSLQYMTWLGICAPLQTIHIFCYILVTVFVAVDSHFVSVTWKCKIQIFPV